MSLILGMPVLHPETGTLRTTFDLTASHSDPKCRFFWRMATPPPYESEYKGLQMPNVIPEGFEDVWETKCESYGKLLKVTLEDARERGRAEADLDASTPPSERRGNHRRDGSSWIWTGEGCFQGCWCLRVSRFHPSERATINKRTDLSFFSRSSQSPPSRSYRYCPGQVSVK